NKDYNLDLSKRRAASVMKWLTDHGVEKSRLASQGFGMTEPIDTNETDAGRANNRRVAFTILERDESKAPAPGSASPSPSPSTPPSPSPPPAPPRSP
ncbi:MAG TPA: OmpA family protein, partial [Labilithrix sp.]